MGPIDVSSALLTLDWKPTRLVDAVAETVAWYADERNIAMTRRLAEDSDSSESDRSEPEAAPAPVVGPRRVDDAEFHFGFSEPPDPKRPRM